MGPKRSLTAPSPPSLCQLVVPARHPPPPGACVRLFSASATCSVAIKPPQPGKPSSPPTPESNHACVKTLQGPVRCSFSILFGFSFQSRFMPKTCAMVKHGDAVFFFATPEGTPGALGTGRSRAVGRTTFFFWRSAKKQSTTMASWATQRENIRQAVEAGSRARDTDDGSRVLGLRRGRGAYALLQRADGSVTRAGEAYFGMLGRQPESRTFDPRQPLVREGAARRTGSGA